MASYAPEDVLRVLTEQGKLPAASIADIQAKVAAGTSLYDVVVDERLVSGEDFTQAEASVLQVPYIDLHGIAIPSETLRIIPESTARGHSIIAYEKNDQECRVAMRDPSDRQMVEFIQKKVDIPVTVALASRESIQLALAQYQKSLDYELEEILNNVGQLQISADHANRG